MLNEKYRRLLLMIGLGAFAALMCVHVASGYNTELKPVSGTLADITLILYITVSICIGAWCATLSVVPTSCVQQSIVFLACGLIAALFITVVARTESSIEILFAFLAMRHALLLLCTHVQKRSLLPFVRQIS